MSQAKLRTYDLDLGDGRIRKVRLDLGALEDAEEVSGYNYLAHGISKVNAKALRALVWASTKHDDPDLTPEYVRDRIHAGNWGEIIKVVMMAYVQAMPEPELEKTEKEEGGEADPLDGAIAEK